MIERKPTGFPENAMIATRSAPKAEEQCIRMSDVPWDVYVAFCDGVGERYVRMTYYQGEMEITSFSSRHEREKARLRCVVEVLTEELDIDMEYGGSMTCRKEEMLAAIEPDECSWIAHANEIVGLDDIDLDRDPPPDLGHEIEISHSMLDRMAIYADLKIPEVWRWDGRTLTIHLLRGKAYRVSKRSKAFPFLPLRELVIFLTSTPGSGNQFRRACRDWVRKYRADWNG
jgi:Putative restriction endonuclease